MSRFAPRAMLLALAATVSIGTLATTASAQSTEERFQDVFVTAGYCTAFGAALGTAFLAFQPNPAASLQFVAMGASLGFIGGSVMGGYIVFSPMIADQPLLNDGTRAPGSLAAASSMPASGFVVRPTYDPKTRTVSAVEGGMTLARF